MPQALSHPTHPAVPAAPTQNFRTIALIVASAMFMEQLDATVLTTALPTMARDFGVTAPNMSVALTSYLLSLAVFIPASGRVADRFGAKLVFRSAIVVFTLGSILCGQANSLPALVAARVFQGLGGAMMMPVGRLVLLRSVERRNMVSAMSWLLVPAMIGPIIGPPVGGFIVTYLDWRWIFYINVPIGCLGFVLVSLFIAETPRTDEGRFDVLGLFLSGIGLGCLFFGFELASHAGERDVALALLGVGAIFAGLYVRHARRVVSPILDLSLMRIPSFGLSVWGGSLTRITQGAQPFLLPLMFQLGFGLTAAQSGTLVLATAVGSVSMKAFAPKLLRRFGFRRSLIVNGVVSSAGYALCAAFRPGIPYGVIFAVLVLCGFFMSFQFTAYNTVAYDEIPHERMSGATSFYTTFQQLMLSVGICIAAVALQGSMTLRQHATVQLADFSTAFLAVSAISLLATFWNVRFSPDAGTEISGHRMISPRSSPAA
ncbi:DHA2 family efflux MFS transporter permease subunit [Lichenihabitans sp. Uapishka_5]|uniref:DHA2 family efflux MFS transporter permease subunit n=1 Tax=Lichenihabitans sp. Uapishka_5 TaxID=3037302 RepID=UPI0029E7E091|nr:DHA2 family efflux MFS transporter permease subunit [Lichenihabitans sp. Uapishka_5]MDX7949806.1 DHA2 family efflux MFS transporter permease subunit [Lichenihabitans sp. Uapishka_5]